MHTALALVPSGAHLAALPNKVAIAQAAAPQICADGSFGMKSSRDSVPYRTGPFTSALVRVFKATKAGALYAIFVFLIGFILGTIRVLLVAPRLGETTAVSIEAPIMLAASWLVCRWCLDRLDVAVTVPARSLMGVVAFLVLMSAEFGLGAVLGRESLFRFPLSLKTFGLGI